MPLGRAALDDLFDAFEHLRRVLDGTDPAAIEAASNRVNQSAAAVRAIGAWRSEPEIIDRLNAILPLLESARVRVAMLADHASQRMAILASHGARNAPLTYGR